jgi:hypothetical protein
MNDLVGMSRVQYRPPKIDDAVLIIIIITALDPTNSNIPFHSKYTQSSDLK